MNKIEEILNKHFHHFYSSVEKQHVIDCMKEYARACCKASLQKAAEDKWIINGKSITNEQNIILL